MSHNAIAAREFKRISLEIEERTATVIDVVKLIDEFDLPREAIYNVYVSHI